MARILIVEDQAELAGVLAENLQVEGHDPRVAMDVAGAKEVLEGWNPDLVILDLIPPGGAGERLLDELRGSDFIGPILILSARGDDRAKVREFREGADEHGAKPFGLLQLLTRVENLLRQMPDPRLPEVIHLDDEVEVHTRARRLRVEGKNVRLRPKEMDLLLALLSRRNEAVHRRTLLAEVWGYSPKAETRTVDWHVATLRSKLGEDAQSPRYLKTVRAVGYRLDVEDPGVGRGVIRGGVRARRG